MNVAQLAVENIETFGEYTSTWFDEDRFTNAEQYRRGGQLAAVLLDQGIRPGDRVVVMMLNSPDVTNAFIAAWKIGAAIIPVTPMWNAREVRYVLEDSGARAVLTSPELAARLLEAAEGLECKVWTVGPSETTALDIGPMRDAAAPHEDIHDCTSDEMGMLLYTSGTTGNPKGVILSHGNLRSAAEACRRNLEGVEPPRGVTALPLSHVYGVLVMNVGYLIGSRSRILRHWDTRQVFEAIEELEVNRLSVVPTMLSYMINFPEREQYDISSLERVGSGGAPLSESVRLEFERLFDCTVAQGYGMSETAGALTGYAHDEQYQVGSVGRPLPGIEMCCMDFDNKVLAPGQTGELCARGANIMHGYLNKAEATREAIVDGWLHTGDVGNIDEQGYVWITDRKKDLIIKGGENISPTEIEEGLYSHPSVAEAAVFAVPDDVFGEDIRAAIVLRPNANSSPEELKEHVGRHVTKFKIPTQIAILDSLPKNPTGKILKRALREQYVESGSLG